MKLKTLLKNAISLLLTLIIVSSILDFIRKPNIPPEINATALYDLQGNAFFLPQLDQAKPMIITSGEVGVVIVVILLQQLIHFQKRAIR